MERSSLISKGRNGVGTDKGTNYEVTDSLAATTFRVFSGSVLAAGGRPPKTVTINAGKAYTFRAKATKKKR